MKKAAHFSQQLSRRKQKISAEQITFAIAALIVAVLVGLVLLSWVTQNHQPPLLSIQLEKTRVVQPPPGQQQYYVPFTIINLGGETAASVQVIGELKIKGEVKESGEQQIDFLSGGETEEGVFIFSQDPQSGELVVRVASYSLP